MLNKDAPKIEPCGTPHITLVDSDTKSPMEKPIGFLSREHRATLTSGLAGSDPVIATGTLASLTPLCMACFYSVFLIFLP